MINANDWLEKLVETLFDDRFCLIKCLVTITHLFGIIHEEDNLIETPGYEEKLMPLLVFATFWSSEMRFSERPHTQ
jgi:hypothetical protein